MGNPMRDPSAGEFNRYRWLAGQWVRDERKGHAGKLKPSRSQRVQRAALGECRVRLPGCSGRSKSVHHLRKRSDGGSNAEGNLVPACDSCHEWIHANEDEARHLGWLR